MTPDPAKVGNFNWPPVGNFNWPLTHPMGDAEGR
jgi:hypothetical protein